jgi:hypothetical protein
MGPNGEGVKVIPKGKYPEEDGGCGRDYYIAARIVLSIHTSATTGVVGVCHCRLLSLIVIPT